ncbi:MAG TPA: prolyl oligopeptidase family serine peptidase [Chitinophagaceae bacterium]|nr:prolyl oligopeptidase family serine peptidase [Chitinophagaceae bacterium]
MKTLFTTTLLYIASFCAMAQENLSYQLPSKEILDLALVERAPSVMMDSKMEYMVLRYSATFKTLNDLNQEELRLGGLRINPITHISSQQTYFTNLKVRKIKGGEEMQVQGLPENPRIANPKFSKDEKKLAFTHTTDTGVELWVLDIATAQAKRICGPTLNASIGSVYSWYTDNEHLLVKLLPDNLPALLDAKKNLPKGPTIAKSEGIKSQNRTFQDLLKTPMDEQNFETLASSELYTIDLNGRKTLYKPKDLYIAENMSPNGAYIMITTIAKPFSYIVPYSRFPNKTNVYDMEGKLIKTINEVPLTEIMPKGFSAVRKGKRSLGWRDDEEATFAYVVALDEGNPENKVEYRDEIFTWKAPFTEEPTSMLKLKQRFDGIQWGDEHTAIASDSWYDTRNTKTYLFDPFDPSKQASIIFDRNEQDVYHDPGSFEMTRNELGRYVLAIEKGQLFLTGQGLSEKGEFPFVKSFDRNTHQQHKLYQSTYTTKKESIISVDTKKGYVLVRIESPTEFPNYYFRNLKSAKKLTQITFIKNPFTSIEGITKEVIHYKRDDGLDLSGTLYLPKGYDKQKKEKLPLLIWAYPEEFKDKQSAGQNKSNPNEFTYPNYGSFVYWVTKGYAILDDASFPIIGEGKEEPNDRFLPQLIADAKAAIDAVDQLGFINRKKVAIGGHSYGAFMTANLLTHSDLFACGIARSGAYNRTLTPFGFQSEQRNYWDVPKVYNEMSPFMNADKMKTPLLLVHGEADNNPGTFTLQTERYFQALKGLGAPVRMVLLPKESHSYAAKENILHLLWEQDTFLEKHLKN